MSGAVLAVLGASGRRVRVTRAERRGAAVLSSALALLAAVMMSLAAVAHAQTSPPLSRIMALAEKGNAKAEYDLGVYYDVGEGGLPKNPERAARWYMKSAGQGYRRAEYNLAYCYHFGKDGLPVNPRLAGQWYGKSAEQGYWRAEFSLAVDYRTGADDRPKSPGLARQWYRKSAAGASRAGWKNGFNLAFAYDLDAGGLPKSRRLALNGFRKSAAQNHPPAIKAHRALGNAVARPQTTVGRSTLAAAAARAAPAGADNQHLAQSLQLFWQAYFQHSNAQLVEFGTPALVQPVSFAGPP